LQNLIKFIFFILFFISELSFAEDTITIISKKLETGDTFYKEFSQVKINNQYSMLFINSLR
jgi:hypothetical protein